MRRPLLTFVLLAYGFTWLAMLPLVLQARAGVDWGWPHWWEGVAAFGPFLAAWLVLRAAGTDSQVFREWRASLTRFGWTTRGWALTVASPLAFLAVALVVAAVATPESERLGAPGNDVLTSVRAMLDLLIVAAVMQSLGEEPGWRGFALERLRARFGPLAATLVLFPAWLFWHLPLFLTRDHFGVGDFAAFSVGILSASIWLTAVREATHSIAAAVVWHALVNVTRGIALGVSTFAFLVFGTAVLAGALLIVLGWWRAAVRGSASAPATAAAPTSTR